MDIIFYKSTNEVNSFPKTLLNGVTVSGKLRSECDILNPVIEFEGIGVDIPYNYCYIPTFKRYYFINDAKSIRNDIIELSMHVDVLQTWRDSIKTSYAYIYRSENNFNPYIVDDEVMLIPNEVSQKRFFISKIPFKSNENPTGSGSQMIISIAGVRAASGLLLDDSEVSVDDMKVINEN